MHRGKRRTIWFSLRPHQRTVDATGGVLLKDASLSLSLLSLRGRQLTLSHRRSLPSFSHTRSNVARSEHTRPTLSDLLTLSSVVA